MKIMQRFPLVFEQKKSFFYWTLDKYIVIIGFQFQKNAKLNIFVIKQGWNFFNFI